MSRLRIAAAVLALVAAVIIGAGRGLFVQPSVALLLIGLAVLPFLIDLLYPRLFRAPAVGLGAIVLVLASVATLMVVQPVASDAAPFLLVLLTARVAATAPVRFSIATGLACIALPEVLSAAGWAPNPVNMPIGTAFAWFAGVELHSQQRLSNELLSAQSALARQAATTERQRIAREIHDLVAHTLSVTMLHLTGARMSLEEHDVAEAMVSLNEAERTGREALREMRQTVGLLGTSTTGQALPGAEDLAQLVSGYRTAGLSVSLETQGDVQAVPGDMGLTIYRIVQESLSNVAKHAPSGDARVLVSVVTSEIRLTIRNELQGRSVSPPGGLGIPGMAERAALLGGSLSAGPIGDAWEVTAILPRASG